jgi:hypothetical protein
MLNHVKRAESFDHLKTIGGIFQSTYQATCKALGLLGDDKEWIESLQEAIFITSSSQLRQLFVSIILFYEVADPKLLFSTFWQYMYNNIISRLRSLYQMPNLQLSDDEIQNYMLYQLELLFNASTTSFSKHNLPMPNSRLMTEIRNKM